MRILIITLLIHLNVIHTGARDWRGIVPLRTTRLEVIRLLGQPKRSQTTKIEYFDLGDKEVTINWIDPTCQKQYPIEADVTVRPEDLVLNISVFPREPIPLKDFNLLPMRANTNCLGNSNCMIWNDEEGISFATTKNGVTQLNYYPTENEFKTWMRQHKICRPSEQFPNF